MRLKKRVIVIILIALIIIVPVVYFMPGGDVEAKLTYLEVTSAGSGTYDDGYIEHSSTDWSTVRDASSGSAVYPDGDFYCIAAWKSGATYYIKRNVLWFDTSAIPDTATVISAHLSLVPNDIDESGYIECDVGVQQFTGSAALSTDDYNDFGGVTSDYLVTSTGVDGVRMNFTVIPSWVSKTGYTALMLREYTHDIGNTAPTGTPGIFDDFSNYEDGPSLYPILNVSYNYKPGISSFNVDADGTNLWDLDGDNIQVDFVLTDSDTDSLKVYMTYAFSPAYPTDPSTTNYDAVYNTGTTYSRSNLVVSWRTNGSSDNHGSGTSASNWVDGPNPIFIKLIAWDGINYSTVNLDSTSVPIGIDGTAPATTVTAIADEAEPTTITGTASDATSGVYQTRLTIKNNTGSTYWTGSAWGAETWLTATGYASWTYDNQDSIWTAGNWYIITANATDNASNVDASPAVEHWNISAGGEPDVEISPITWAVSGTPLTGTEVHTWENFTAYSNGSTCDLLIGINDSAGWTYCNWSEYDEAATPNLFTINYTLNNGSTWTNIVNTGGIPVTILLDDKGGGYSETFGLMLWIPKYITVTGEQSITFTCYGSVT